MIPRPLILIALMLCSGAALAEDVTRLLEKARKAADAGQYAQADGMYQKILKEAPDSEEAGIARERLAPNALLRVVELEHNGDAGNRVDVFVMAEGYTREKKFQRQFDRAARNTLKFLDQAPTFRRYRKHFNYYAMNIASKEEGVDADGRDFDTALGAYKTKYVQGQVAVRHELVASYLRQDPRAEGFAIVIARLGTFGTGGGGVATVGGGPSNTVIHEWGHAFGDLVDEYTFNIGYTGKIRTGTNVTDSPDPEQAPWKHWLEVDQEGVGMFAGGDGRSIGAWRATASGCAMAEGPSFCLVCRETLTANIYNIVSPIDDATPEDRVIVVERDRPQSVQVTPMGVVGSPQLQVSFALEESQESFEPSPEPRQDGSPWNGGSNPFESTGNSDDFATASRQTWVRWDRPSRFGKRPDPPLEGRDVPSKKRRQKDGRTAMVVTLDAAEFEPGSYLLRARVKDPTEWVLKKEWIPLLTDTRTWRVLVR